MEISNNEFEYTGKGCVVPKDVTSVRFHPSVIEIGNGAFQDCNELREGMCTVILPYLVPFVRSELRQ